MMLLVLLQIGGQKTNLLVSFHSFACCYQRNRSGSMYRCAANDGMYYVVQHCIVLRKMYLWKEKSANVVFDRERVSHGPTSLKIVVGVLIPLFKVTSNVTVTKS